MRIFRLFVVLITTSTLVGCQATSIEKTTGDNPAEEMVNPVVGSSHLFLWSADADHQEDDFLAVIDVREDSPTFAQVVQTLTVGEKFTIPHHTEHELDASGQLFANGFKSGHTFIFDLQQPTQPRLLNAFKPPAPYKRPHSYVRMPNGNVLMTIQSDRGDHQTPGGLAEVSAKGKVLRTVKAEDSAVDPHILPYSIAIVPALDRVVTTSADMHERWVSHVIQVWRLSDLGRIRTVVLPPGPRGKEGWDAAEPRLLQDGKTVLVSTFNCGLYKINGLEGTEPIAEFVYGFEGGGCALAVVVGRYWIQTVPDAHSLVALDVSNPSRPQEVSRLVLGSGFSPHWIAAEPGGRRIVMTSYGPRVLLISLDPASGRLGLIEKFRDLGSNVVGVSFDRAGWPHGQSGKAEPHGAVFSAH